MVGPPRPRAACRRAPGPSGNALGRAELHLRRDQPRGQPHRRRPCGARHRARSPLRRDDAKRAGARLRLVRHRQARRHRGADQHRLSGRHSDPRRHQRTRDGHGAGCRVRARGRAHRRSLPRPRHLHRRGRRPGGCTAHAARRRALAGRCRDRRRHRSAEACRGDHHGLHHVHLGHHGAVQGRGHQQPLRALVRRRLQRDRVTRCRGCDLQLPPLLPYRRQVHHARHDARGLPDAAAPALQRGPVLAGRARARRDRDGGRRRHLPHALRRAAAAGRRRQPAPHDLLGAQPARRAGGIPQALRPAADGGLRLDRGEHRGLHAARRSRRRRARPGVRRPITRWRSSTRWTARCRPAHRARSWSGPSTLTS